MVYAILQYDNYIIEIRKANFPDESAQNSRHQSLISQRRVTEPERQLRHLVEFDVRYEGRFLNVC